MKYEQTWQYLAAETLKLSEYQRKQLAMILIASTIGIISRDEAIQFIKDHE